GSITVLLRVFTTVLLLASVPALFGQGGRASITGVVADSSGASVPSATVTATNTGTAISTSTTTSETGTYTLPLLPVGTYTVTVKKDGFKTETRSGVILTADQVATLNTALTVGAVSDEVKVTADAEMLQTVQAALGQVIQERSIVELPLNGRNPASLVLLTPGMINVLQTGGGVRQGYTTFPTEEGASANGGRQGSTLYLLDGALNMDNYHLLAAPFPNADATQEFRVLGNNFEAQYGFAPGAVVSIVTKSGTNEFHGNAFEFLRNGKLNARDFFYSGRDELKRNQYGASFGGPIVKEKAFFFANYQGTKERLKVAGSTAYVPSDAMLNGDFSAYVNAGIPIMDPDTGQPAPGGYISPTRFSPGALKVVESLPRTTDPLGKVVVTGYSNVRDFQEFTLKGDVYHGSNHRFSGRTFFNDFSQPEQNNSLLNSDRSWLSRWQNHTFNYTWTAGPTLVNNATFAYTRLFDSSVSGLRDKDGKRICYSQFIKVADPESSPCSIESLDVSGAFGFGQNFNGLNRWTWSISDSITKTKGRHMIVAGVDVLRQYWDLGTDWLALPIIGFDGSVTGQSMSDFLVGQVSSYLQGGGEYQRLHATQFGTYVQDQIRLKPNLTMSIGVRWEPFLAPVPSSGRIPVFSPGMQSTRYPNAPLGVVFPGDKGVPDAGVKSGYNYFNPRLGFAWQPSFLKHTSIRAAFGIFTAPIDYSSWNHSADSSPFSTTYSFNRYDPAVGNISFDDPWASYAPTGRTSPFPPFPTPSSSPSSDATFTLPMYFQAGFNRNFRLARNQTWNLSIERQIKENWLVRAAYVGSETYHLINAIERNPGIFAADGARTLYPDFSSVLEMASWATANYQSLQLTVEKRFSHGFQVQSNYTYSKNLDSSSFGSLAFTGSVADPFNMRNNRGLSSMNFPHVFVTNFVWELPGLRNSHPVARGVLGGWQLSGIWHIQSGAPFGISPGSGSNNSLSQIGADRADYVPGQEVWTKQGDKNDWLNKYFNTAAFQKNAPGTFGNTPRNLLRGPRTNSWDLGISKNWRFADRYRLQFRWEMFNAFNTPSFGNPSTSASSAQFGQITSTGSVPPRVMQGALKMSF
ncbi:MAG TPA: carboxypeptidase regulatory-like domain-containing protein, partial [Bryobacteraceae bacterium]|nr:carboxypeptidase regulatory-like domain-containing protein [Bryobacteraceae bacterium]